MRGKKAKKTRQEMGLKIQELHTFQRADGSEGVVKVFDTGIPDHHMLLVEEGGGFEEALMFLYCAPMGAVQYVWDKSPMCGNSDCRIVMFKFEHPERKHLVPFCIGLGAGAVIRTEIGPESDQLKNPSAPYFEHPCDICRIGYQKRATEIIRERVSQAQNTQEVPTARMN